MNSKRQLEVGILPDCSSPDYLVKVVLAGDSGVGKTNILSQFVRNQFNPVSLTTIGVEFATKTVNVNDKTVKAQIWDTAGQERYRAITSTYYKGAKGAILVYDITVPNSFTNLERWIKEIRNNTENPKIPILLVGNKIDLKDERRILEEEGKNLAAKEEMIFMETSALMATNVNEAFYKLIEWILVEDEKNGLFNELNNDKNKKINLKKGESVEPNGKSCCCC